MAPQRCGGESGAPDTLASGEHLLPGAREVPPPLPLEEPRGQLGPWGAASERAGGPLDQPLSSETRGNGRTEVQAQEHDVHTKQQGERMRVASKQSNPQVISRSDSRSTSAERELEELRERALLGLDQEVSRASQSRRLETAVSAAVPGSPPETVPKVAIEDPIP
eukprot:11247171-Alexandrium_andersonii.AAC.1